MLDISAVLRLFELGPRRNESSVFNRVKPVVYLGHSSNSTEPLNTRGLEIIWLALTFLDGKSLVERCFNVTEGNWFHRLRTGVKRGGGGEGAKVGMEGQGTGRKE